MRSYILASLVVALAMSSQTEDIKARQEPYVDFSCPPVAGMVSQFGVCCDAFTNVANTFLTGVGLNCTKAKITVPSYYTCVNTTGSTRACCKVPVANTSNFAGCSNALPYGQQGTVLPIGG